MASQLQNRPDNLSLVAQQAPNLALSDTAKATVAQSARLLKSHRQHLSRAMQEYFARWDSADPVPMLFDMLFDHASSPINGALLPKLAETARRHRLLGLLPGTYALFGDGLGAIMRDVLGPRASPAVVAAWGDTYWAIVRSLSESNSDSVE